MKEKPLTSRQLQAWTNFRYALRHHGLEMYFEFGAAGTHIEQDRLVVPLKKEYQGEEDIFKLVLLGLATFEQDDFYLKSAHPGAYASFRQCCSLWAMQITLLLRDGKRYADIDCDRGQPNYSGLGAIVHLGEVIVHKITGGKTDPYPVRAAWNRRGVGIPLIEDKQAA